MSKCSTVISFDYDVDLLSKWRTVIMEHQDPKHNEWVLEHLDLNAMTIDQMPFKIQKAFNENISRLKKIRSYKSSRFQNGLPLLS